MPEVIETDVLVVGGGGAGCRAAIEAHDRGAAVLMLVKGGLGNSGCTLNVGTSAVVGPWAEEGDSDMVSMRDLVSYGGYLANQELGKILAEESYDRVEEMEGWGIDFDRTDDGSIAINRAAAHTYSRNFNFKPSSPSHHDYGAPGGMAIMDVLVGEVRKKDVTILEETVLVDLLAVDGRVVGATALDCRSGELVVFMAKAVILATGTYSRVFSRTTVSPHETGDGQAAAYRVGAELMDMENTQFVPTTVGIPVGSTLLNASGEPFLERYGMDSPVGATKEKMCYVVWSEVLRGRGTVDKAVMIDMTGVPREGQDAAYMSVYGEGVRTTGSAYPGFKGEPVDPAAGPFLTAPLAHTTTGGVRINGQCESTVPGLYAAGAVAGGVYGHTRPEGFTSMITLVFGRRAGLFAAEWCRQAGPPKSAKEAIQASLGRATKLAETARAVDFPQIKARAQGAMTRYGWVIKDESKLSRGLEEIRSIGGMLRPGPGGAAPGRARPEGHAWAAALDVPNLLLCSELMLEGAIMRRESRGAFFRSDYPETDDANWLRNIIHKLLDGRPAVDTVPVELKYCGPEPSYTAG